MLKPLSYQNIGAESITNSVVINAYSPQVNSVWDNTDMGSGTLLILMMGVSSLARYKRGNLKSHHMLGVVAYRGSIVTSVSQACRGIVHAWINKQTDTHEITCLHEL